MNDEEFFSTLISEAQKAAFSGWNFEYVTRTGREIEGVLPWSYSTEVIKYIRKAKSVLDIGTGGGELLSLLAPLPKNTCATEAYKPNVPVARKRLGPLGVKVYSLRDFHDMPFKDGQFDLVINRHEAYSDKEVFRILKPGGIFITQQVGAYTNIEINKALGAHLKKSKRYLRNEAKDIESTGMKIITKREAYLRNRFYDIGAVVYYLLC